MIMLEEKIKLIIEYYNIDEDLFNQKLKERLLFSSSEGIERKESYILAIIKAMIKEENLINTKKDYNDIPKYTIIDLMNRLRSCGFAVDPNEPEKIENIILYLRNNKYMNCNQIREFLDRAIEYLIVKKQKTSNMLIELFLKSKTTGGYINGKIDIKTLGVI